MRRQWSVQIRYQRISTCRWTTVRWSKLRLLRLPIQRKMMVMVRRIRRLSL